jgi:hypothetical protein
MTLSEPVRRAAILAIAIACLGAFAFGLWHIVVGGLVNGNPRAAAFGVTLAAVAGGFLLGLALAFRRHRPAA